MVWTPSISMLQRLTEEHFNSVPTPDPNKFYLILCNPVSAFTSATDLATVIQAESLQANGYVRSQYNPAAGTYDASAIRYELPSTTANFSALGASYSFNTAYLLSGASATANKPVTSMTAANDQITITGHGLAVGDKVLFTGTGAIANPLVKGTIYYVQAIVDVDNLKIAATNGGALINLTTDSSGSLDARYANGELEFFEAYSTITIPAGGSHSIAINVNFTSGVGDANAA